MRPFSQTLDLSALTLSSLCLIHCLLLPFAAAALPIFSVFAEMEWVHKLFVMLAVPISLVAFYQSRNVIARWIYPAALAAVGLGFLIASGFMESLHDHERVLTVIGAITLAVAHLWRWRLHLAR